MLTPKNALRVAALIGAVITASWSSAQTQTEFALHMEASHLNTAGDPTMVNYWRAFYCNLPDNNNQIVVDQRAKNTIRVPLTQLFDDVWFLGSEYVGQYILKNASGFMMIDAGNNSTEAQTYIVPALQTLGLSATMPLNTILLTHGHGDHDGGAQYLKTAFNPSIYLGAADVNLGGAKTYSPILWDSSVLTPYDVNVGGRTVTVLATPGHTAGATAYIITAHDHGKEVKLFVAGGSSMQTGVPTIVSYQDSMERLYAMLKAQKAESASNPHVYWDGSLVLIKKIQAEGFKSPSRFIIGNSNLLRAMAIGRECTAAFLNESDATKTAPVWRVSSIDFMPASPTPTRMAVKVSNGWGPVASQPVTFSVAGGDTVCSATTDSTGVATCASPSGPFRPGADQVTASFAGATHAGYIDLGSDTTAAFNNGCSDLSAVKASMGSRKGDAKFVTRLDVDNNAVIDLRDVAAVARLVPAGTVCQ
jgi:glyoxylase-like metal-dependent hydrolase (beta-lactamase superfamily II)